MNIHTKIRAARPPAPPVPARRRFTADELLIMEEKGILHPEENVELIDGEVITMAPKSPRHDDMCAALLEHVTDHRPRDVRVTMDPALRLASDQEPEPDLILFPARLRPSQVRGDTALLVVEVAVTSLSHDLVVKAPIYAAHGVREYWVVDARRVVTHVHREPGPDGYGSVREVPGHERIAPLLVPAVALALADLGLPPLADDDTDDAA